MLNADEVQFLNRLASFGASCDYRRTRCVVDLAWRHTALTIDKQEAGLFLAERLPNMVGELITVQSGATCMVFKVGTREPSPAEWEAAKTEAALLLAALTPQSGI